MADAQPTRGFFLFRSDAGAIDAPTWRFHAAWMAGALLAATLGWRLLAPYAHHDLAKSAFIAPMTILAFAYLLVFAFGVLFTAISFYNLTAKRLRARSLPTGLAGLIPLLALFAGAAHWLQPQVPDVIAIWYVVGLDVLLAGAVAWSVATLGFAR